MHLSAQESGLVDKKPVSERTIIPTEKALLFGPPEDHESPSSLPVKCSYPSQVSWSVLYSHQDHPLDFFSNFALNRRLQSLRLTLKTTYQTIRNVFGSDLKLQTRCFKSFRKLSQNLSPPHLHQAFTCPISISTKRFSSSSLDPVRSTKHRSFNALPPWSRCHHATDNS